MQFKRLGRIYYIPRVVTSATPNRGLVSVSPCSVLPLGPQKPLTCLLSPQGCLSCTFLCMGSHTWGLWGLASVTHTMFPGSIHTGACANTPPCFCGRGLLHRMAWSHSNARGRTLRLRLPFGSWDACCCERVCIGQLHRGKVTLPTSLSCDGPFPLIRSVQLVTITQG